MADEQKKNASQTAKTVVKVILGIGLLVLGVWLLWLWRWDVWTIIKGFMGLAVILAGVISLAIAKE